MVARSSWMRCSSWNGIRTRTLYKIASNFSGSLDRSESCKRWSHWLLKIFLSNTYVLDGSVFLISISDTELLFWLWILNFDVKFSCGYISSCYIRYLWSRTKKLKILWINLAWISYKSFVDKNAEILCCRFRGHKIGRHRCSKLDL